MKRRSSQLELPPDIAIIGMSGFFPRASDLGAFWHNILNLKVATEEIPPERWDWHLYYDADLNAPDKVVSRWGAYLPDIVFDPLQYGIPPNSLNYTESTQLLLLESTRLALANAGYGDDQRSFDRERTSVFIGTGAGEGDLGQKFSFRSMLSHYFGESAAAIAAGLKRSLPEWNPDAFTGVITNIAAGRVANRFNLGGTNHTLDAACASALAALRAGVMELRAGESDLVIVGGADTLMSPFAFSCFSKVGALSPRGECRAFDEKADGIVLGEAVATVILKRLAEARADGDRIYAVIKGIAASSDGRAKSLTAPSRQGQLLALKRAYDNAGVDPGSVGLIEAHGTGTKVGDQSEAEALHQFFGDSGMAAKSCAVGSIKSLIGHAKCAAGIGSLIKTVLALHHKVLPPTWGVETPIVEMDGPDNPLYLNTQSRPWIHTADHPRRAGVSAFGFGGTNFHVVLEEALAPEGEPPHAAFLPAWATELLVFRAADRDAMSRQLSALKQQLQTRPGEAPYTLHDIARTLAARPPVDHDQGPCLAVVAGSLDDLAQKLASVEERLARGDTSPHQPPAGIYFHEGAPVAAGQIAFVFPGQGSQYTGMLQDLGVSFGVVREVLERFDGHLHDVLPKPLSRYIYPPGPFSAEARKYNERDLTQTHIAQPAMGAMDAAMLALFDQLGVRPAMTAGHSYGEYAALHAAGVLDERALALISEARGRFILEAAQPQPGTMAAVKAPEKDVAHIIEGLDQVWIANLNAPQQTVISGSRDGVRTAIQRLGEQGIACVAIPVACAFHSPIVAGAQERLKSFFSRFSFQPARLPVYSNTSAALFPAGDDAIQALLARQLVCPVRFVEEIEAMYAAGARLFVEVGAGNVLTNLIGGILDQRTHTAVCTDTKGRPSVTRLQHALAQLAVLGVPLKLDILFNQRGGRILDLAHLADSATVPLPKTAYIIGKKGIRAVTRTQSPQAHEPRPVCFADELPIAPPVPFATEPPRFINPLPDGEIMDRNHMPPIVSDSAIDADVMARFQDLMGQFLETQRAVMTAYLKGCQLDAGVLSAADFGFQPAPSRSNARQGAAGESPAPAVISHDRAAVGTAPSMAPPPTQAVDVAGMLLGIVSDRTGYPQEMLDLGLEIESDLGIDSIKRVQITETLVNGLETHGIILPTEELAAIAGSVTLGGIIDKLSALVDQGASPRGAAGPTAGEVEVPCAFDVSSALLAIVSDRTGYPADMLDVNLEIESDLGIDSIKRVQITESLVATLESQGISLPTEELAGIAGSVTLCEIIDKLQAVLAAATARTPAGAPKSAVSSVPSTGTAPDLNVATVLTTIVSERTGYPPDMLDLDLEIESDLGMDSIKRVQIIESLVTVLEKQGIILPTDELAAIAGSNTLGEIIVKLNGLIARQTSSAAVQAPPETEAGTASRAEAPAARTVGQCMSDESLYDLLYRLIQQHTGFPRETLAPDLEWHLLDMDPEGTCRLLDAFTAAVEERVGAVLTLDREKGAAAVYLSDVVALMADATHSPDDSERQTGTRAIRRFVLAGREKPLLTTIAGDVSGQTVVVTRMPDDPVADGIVARLRDLQVQVLALSHGASLQTGTDNLYTADLTVYDHVTEAVAHMRRLHGPITGLLHLVPMAPVEPFDAMTLPQWRHRNSLEVKSLFYLSQLLADDLTAAADAGKASLVATTLMGEGFGSLADPAAQPAFFPGSGAITGFLKTLAMEIPGINIRALDLDPGAPVEDRVHQVIDEWTTPSTDVEVAYRAGRRMILDVAEAPVDATRAPTLAIDADWRLLVTGGARGITATIALELARRFQPTLLLVGRTPLGAAEAPETAGIDDHKRLKAIISRLLKAERPQVKPKDVEQAYVRLIRQREVKGTLSQLQAAGARVDYFEADVTDEEAFGRVIDAIHEKYGRIDGVLHGAGLIQDKMVRDKDVQSFSRVFDTKADSLFILSRKLKPGQLRFLALFSSVAGRFGNPGQSDYAAANEVYNKAALYLNSRWPGRVASLMWGPWESQGMVSAELRQKFEAMGISLIPPQVGTAHFMDEISYGDPARAEVVFGGWDDRKRAVSPFRQAELLPLFFVNTNFKPLVDGRVEVVRRLEIERDLFLNDHLLDGRPVVPMAMAMEMMAEAVAYRYPDYHLTAILDLKVYRGIILKNGREHVRIAATPLDKSEDGVALKVMIRSPEADGRIYYEARAELSKYPQVMRPHVGLDLSEPASFPIPLEEAYQRYLFHGPLWQGIETIHSVGRDGIIGDLKLSRPTHFLQGASEQLRWLVDPLVIDSGLQLASLWLRHRFEVTPLPSQMKKYLQYGPAPSQGPLRCEVRVNNPEKLGVQQADLYFIRPDNHLFARIEGLEIIGSSALNRLSNK